MRIYKYSMGFRTPAVDQSYSSIYYNHDLNSSSTLLITLLQTFLGAVHYQSNGKWDPNNCSEQDGYDYSPAARMNWGEGIKKKKLQEIRTCIMF